MTALSERLQLARSTVTELVARAENASLTRDSSTDDGRVVFFSLTSEGDRRLEALVRCLRTEPRTVAKVITAFRES
jgi:DNA-binding MarR family transcriptional regulator